MASCSCTEHNVISKREDAKVVKVKSKKIKVATLNYLLSEQLMPKHGLALCEDCIQYYGEKVSTKRIRIDFVGETISQIESGNVNDTDLTKLSVAIGNCISKNVYDDGEKNALSNDIEAFKEDFKLKDWLLQRNEVLLGFLMSVANIKSFENNKKMLCVAGSLQSIYKARSVNLVLPIPFYANLVSYYISGSSALARLNSATSPAGSYNCLKSWLSKSASVPINLPSKINDNVTFFDNNQVIARNWRITYNHKTKASVITTLIHIEPSHTTHLQTVDGLSPANWLYNQSNKHVINQVDDMIRQTGKTFGTLRDQYVEHRMQLVKSHIQVINGDPSDEISRYINDNIQPNLKLTEADPYSWVPTNHPDNAPKIVIGEPCMANPCSYEAVGKVFKHIQEHCGVGKEKKWAAVGSDGLPYTLGQKLIEKSEEFKNLLLIPGNGHIEMNATRAIVKLLWDVVIEDLAKLNGFRTPRALLAAKSCSSHHKSWQLLSILMFGTMDEILSTFIKYSLKNKTNITTSNFYDYISKSTDPNFRFMCDIILNYVLALFIFRCGVRRGNDKVITAGKNQFTKLYFGLNMTTYQFLAFHDLKTRVCAPDAIKHFLCQTESFSVSGLASKGEGGDFVLEAVNGKTKRWLPPGAPTEQQWKDVCRNIDKLEQIRDKLYTEYDMHTNATQMYQRDMSREIFQWRVKLRQTEYLANKYTATVNNHTSLSGVILDRDLVAFENTCTRNFSQYMKSAGNGRLPGKGLSLTPVFTTVNDREKYHDIRNKTKCQISVIITELLKDVERFGNVQEALVLERQWEKIKVGTKDALLQFYREVTVAVQEASNGEETENETDSPDDNEDSVDE